MTAHLFASDLRNDLWWNNDELGKRYAGKITTRNASDLCNLTNVLYFSRSVKTNTKTYEEAEALERRQNSKLSELANALEEPSVRSSM
jgi:hypothetical protein